MTIGEPALLEVSRSFPHSPAQISLARLFVRETLTRWGEPVDDPSLHDLVLMTSELFTNAVLHGAGTIEVSVSLTPHTIRVAVADRGRHGLPRPRVALPRGAPGGRGLQIVARLAFAWGSGRDEHGGTQVWLEVPRP